MGGIFRLLGAIAVALALMHASGDLQRAEAQVATRQVKLTEQQIVAFIAAQKQMASAKEDAEFEDIAKQHGFTGLEEHDAVEANILLLMDGIDPQTKAFSEPPTLIKRRIDQVKADTSLPDAERKQALEELTEALKTAKPIEYPANIELVRKYYDKIQAVLE
jgi:hypothetical protein